MKKLFFVLLLIAPFANSQISNKHWLPPLHANESGDPGLVLDHWVYLSTPEPTPFAVTVTYGNGDAFPGSPFTISQGNPVYFKVGDVQPSAMMVDRVDVGIVINTRKGLILEGSKDFYVSFRVRATNHAEFLSSKGTTGIGTTFRLGSLPQSDFGGIRNFVSSFMATQDNTTVNLSGYNPNISFISGNTTLIATSQTFVLNEGESVVVSGYTQGEPANLDGFVGALLTSDKPIAVITGNMCGGMLSASDGQDFNLDQIVSLEQVGKEYVIVKGNGSDSSERPLVIAHENNTEVFVNGSATPITTLNAGQFFLIPSSNFLGTGNNQNMYINTSKPIFLYQIVAGSDSDATSGFYFIPPLSCFWQESVDLIPDFDKIGNFTFNQSEIIVVTESGSAITVNGNPVTAMPQQATGNPNWETYRISGLSGNVAVVSTGALAVGVFGVSGVAGYGGYFSGFGSIPSDSQTVICTGSIVNLFDRITGNPETNGTWTVPAGAPPLNGNLFAPTINLPGIYTYTFSKVCDGITRIFPINIDVSIQPGPFAGTNTSKSYCATDAQEDLFDLLGNNVTTGGSWTFNGASITNGILNPATNQSGNYTYTIPASGACDEVSATIAVTINSNPEIYTITDYELCDNALDGNDANGMVTFNLSTKNNEIIGTQSNISITYHNSLNDAELGINPLPNNYYAASGIVYARLRNTITGCLSVNQFNIVVNPKPVIQNIVSLKQCDDDTDAITDFNLSEANTIISSDNTLSYTYYTSLANALSNTNPITNYVQYTSANNGKVFAKATTTKGCERIAEINLLVSVTQINNSYLYTLNECDDYLDTSDLENDGYDYFDFTLATQDIISQFPSGQNPIVTYYESQTDALQETNQISNITNYRNIVANQQDIWVRIDSAINNECLGLGTYLRLIVNPIPEIELGENFALCLDPATGIGSQIINATPNASGSYSYQWTPSNPDTDSLGNESALYNITQGGTFSVVVTNNATLCVNTDSIIATFSSEPLTFTATLLTPAFSSGLSSIEGVATGGYGEYEYSIDLVNWQSSPIFTELPNGAYTIYVRDIQGCGIKTSDIIQTITFPNFFTPNNDGYNDTWSITGLPIEYNAIISIFDRYGKLLKQISSNGEGWNGFYNARPMPATDYWFKVEYTESGTRKEFSSNFSLKR